MIIFKNDLVGIIETYSTMMMITKLSILSIINDTDIQVHLICPKFWERVISSHVCIHCPNSKSGAYLLMFQQNEVKHNLKFVLQLQYLLFNEFES